MATKLMKSQFRLSRKVFSYPYILFMLLFVVTPLVMILVNAFLKNDMLTLENFSDFFGEAQNLKILGNSILIAFIVTVLCLLIGFPTAYFISKYYKGSVFVLLFILPMWVNFLMRTLASRSMYQAFGFELGLGTLIMALVYNFLPFMILPLHTSLAGIDKGYSEAAYDLGADDITVFTRVTLPLAVPGIISGITMVFIPTISTFAISDLLSGSATITLFGDSIFEKFDSRFYGVGSVMSLIMMALVLISNYFIGKYSKRETEAKNLW